MITDRLRWSDSSLQEIHPVEDLLVLDLRRIVGSVHHNVDAVSVSNEMIIDGVIGLVPSEFPYRKFAAA